MISNKVWSNHNLTKLGNGDKDIGTVYNGRGRWNITPVLSVKEVTWYKLLAIDNNDGYKDIEHECKTLCVFQKKLTFISSVLPSWLQVEQSSPCEHHYKAWNEQRRQVTLSRRKHGSICRTFFHKRSRNSRGIEADFHHSSWNKFLDLSTNRRSEGFQYGWYCSNLGFWAHRQRKRVRRVLLLKMRKTFLAHKLTCILQVHMIRLSLKTSFFTGLTY